MPMVTDLIVKKTMLRASRSRVWRAIADSKEFGDWFGVKFDGPFTPGASVHGVIVPTKVDPEVAEIQKKYEGSPFEIIIEKMDAERLFSFRWHPYGHDPDYDYSSEPTTLIEFRLEEEGDGTWLTVTESGFDRIPLARRAEAFSNNEGGWTMQMKLVEKYLAQGS